MRVLVLTIDMAGVDDNGVPNLVVEQAINSDLGPVETSTWLAPESSRSATWRSPSGAF